MGCIFFTYRPPLSGRSCTIFKDLILTDVRWRSKVSHFPHAISCLPQNRATLQAFVIAHLVPQSPESFCPKLVSPPPFTTKRFFPCVIRLPKSCLQGFFQKLFQDFPGNLYKTPSVLGHWLKSPKYFSFIETLFGRHLPVISGDYAGHPCNLCWTCFVQNTSSFSWGLLMNNVESRLNLWCISYVNVCYVKSLL